MLSNVVFCTHPAFNLDIFQRDEERHQISAASIIEQPTASWQQVP